MAMKRKETNQLEPYQFPIRASPEHLPPQATPPPRPPRPYDTLRYARMHYNGPCYLPFGGGNLGYSSEGLLRRMRGKQQQQQHQM